MITKISFLVKIRSFCKLYLFLLFFLSSALSFSQLKVGDNAPGLTITHWIQNNPKSISLKDKFYIIDFWATWCAPCLASVDHMNDLAEQNKGNNNLVFLSLTDEKKEKVLPILSRVLFKTAVVSDTTEKTQAAYKITAIPNCVIVDDKGIIQWTGNPKNLTADNIKEILKRKPVVVINKKEKIPAEVKKQYDSLSSAYEKLCLNTDVKEYFDMALFSNKAYSYEASTNSPSKLIKYQIGYQLKDILPDILSVSKSQVSLPPDIANLYVVYCYISEKNVNNEDVFNAILTHQKLASNKTDSMQDIISLDIFDRGLLNPIAPSSSSWEEGRFSKSDDDRFICLSNSPMSEMIGAIQDKFNCPVILNDPSFIDRRVDMLLETDNITTLENSLKIYGIHLKKEKKLLPYFSIVHK